MPMFTATFYFLGVAAFLLAASACFSKGRRSDRSVEVDVAALRVALLCLSAADDQPTRDEKTKRHGINALWMKWYNRCQEKALLKREAMYSWSRTLALSSVLCIVGVCLETEFDEP